MKIPIITSAIVLLVSIAAYYGWSTYPERRVITWVELLTDGFAPDFLAEGGRAILAQLWRDIFGGGHMERSGLFDAIVQDIRRLSANEQPSSADIIEMAAGSGVPAGLWHQALRKKGIAVRSIITDLQPTPGAWNEVVQEFNNETSSSSITYIGQPVDATDASAVVSKHMDQTGSQKNAVEVRMIHFALHHIPPKHVQAMFQDAVQANSAILVADLVPSIENVLLNSPLGLLEFIRTLPQESYKHPWRVLLLPVLAPLIAVAILHDPTVSVLRSYSHDELQEMLDKCTGGVEYRVQSFKFYSFAEYLGIPPVLPFLKKPHLQVFWAAPVITSNGNRSQEN